MKNLDLEHMVEVVNTFGCLLSLAVLSKKGIDLTIEEKNNWRQPIDTAIAESRFEVLACASRIISNPSGKEAKKFFPKLFAVSVVMEAVQEHDQELSKTDIRELLEESQFSELAPQSDRAWSDFFSGLPLEQFRGADSRERMNWLKKFSESIFSAEETD